jgi:hypothetical protein
MQACILLICFSPSFLLVCDVQSAAGVWRALGLEWERSAARQQLPVTLLPPALSAGASGAAARIGGERLTAYLCAVKPTTPSVWADPTAFVPAHSSAEDTTTTTHQHLTATAALSALAPAFVQQFEALYHAHHPNAAPLPLLRDS